MKTQLISIIMLTLALLSCSEETVKPSVQKEFVSGQVQKGPFLNGTSIVISELETDLSQTGKTYQTQITNNQGSFEIQNLALVSNYVSLKADGFYFNEIQNEKSVSQITLFALSDVSDKSTININLLSHLEKARVEYLIRKGFSFSEAKIQAQREVLNIFGFALTENQPSELLDITKEGDDNAILLASSLILQGLRTEAELTELLANISTDLKEDGVLNDHSLGAQLMNHAVFLDTNSIRGNLEQRYAALGIETNIPNFEKYLAEFINNAEFEASESLFEYPAEGRYGLNILDVSRTNYPDGEYSLAANLAKGAKLTIKITALGEGIWYYSSNSPKNWAITTYDFDTKSQYFTSINSDESCDLNMIFDPGSFLIEYYEMNASEPTRTKTINK